MTIKKDTSTGTYTAYHTSLDGRVTSCKGLTASRAMSNVYQVILSTAQ